jgi:Zn-dependent protease
MSDENPPSGALRVARVAGVPVYLDRTWLLLALFIAWTGWSAGAGLGAGLALAYAAWLVVGILVAVLGHEVAHALTARLLGYRVHRIVATLWGGHTSFDGTGSTPGRSAAVAVAGPVANLLLAAVGWLAYVWLDWPASEFAWSFLFLNLLLAAFNLLPGLPLDGGQLVDSLVWVATGRRDRGLLVAGWTGRVLALTVLGWFGIRPFLVGAEPDLISVVLSVVMAWILWTGASAAIARAPYERLVSVVRLEDVLEEAVAVPALTTVGELPPTRGRLLATDEQGRPSLILPLDAPGAPDLAILPPTTRLSSLVERLPDGCVVEVGEGAGTAEVVRALAATRAPLVVVTRGGSLLGVVTAQRFNTVAGAVLGRN